MFGKKHLRLVGLTLVLMLALGLGAAQAQDGVTIIIAWEQEPDAPSVISSAAFSAYMDNFFQRDVWDWDQDRNIFPVMVEEVPSADNGLVTYADIMWDDDQNPDTPDVAGQAPVVTYKLRAGMKWSDGEAITADDCLFYHNLMMQPDPLDSVGERGFYPDVVGSAEKVDDLTVALTYSKPWPDYQADAVMSCNIPAHINGAFMDSDGDGVFDANFDQSPYGLSFQDVSGAVGYGPFMLSEFNTGENAVFTKNPNWGANEWEKVPAMDTLITQFITQSQQMENALEVGDVDVAFNFDGVNNSYGEMANVTKFVTDTVFEDAIWFNAGPLAHPAMQDVRVRQALTHAIDRRTLANLLAGEGAGELLSTSWYFPQYTSPNLEFLEYDVDKARELLTEAGWVDADGDESADNASPSLRVSQGATLPDGTAVPDGEALILRFYTTPRLPRPDAQTIVAADLAKVGVNSQVFVVNGANVLFGSYASRSILYRGEYDIAIYALSASPLSPNGAVANFHCSGIPSAENPSGANNTWFCNEEYDQLDTQIASELDPAKRLELVYRATELMYAHATRHALFPRPTWYAVRTDRLDPESMKQMGTLASNYFNKVEDWVTVG